MQRSLTVADVNFVSLQSAVFCVQCELLSDNNTPRCLACGSAGGAESFAGAGRIAAWAADGASHRGCGTRPAGAVAALVGCHRVADGEE